MTRGAAKQLVLRVSGEVRLFDLAPNGEAVVIGRAPDAQLRVDAALVSRRHCAIRLGDRGLEVRDLGSLNGTYLNGLKVTTAPLNEGDLVRVGECEIAVGTGHENALSCRRCGRLASLATVEDGGQVQVAGEIICAACNTGGHYTSPAIEKKLSDALDADGFEVLARVSSRTSSCPVFKARRRDLDDVVALKILPILGEIPEKKLERFKAEARVMAQLKHPNVVPIYDVRHRPTLSILVMEFVPGETLLQRIERKKKLRVAESLKHAISIARALEAAGKLGIAHRNVKPSNVIVSRATGEARLIDFGLARNLRHEKPGLTNRTTPLGTIRYMAPEQMRDPHAADERSDIYSLAATIFHALTGKLPRHERNELELLEAAVEGRALPFDLSREREVPQGLKNVLACALMLDPRDRQPSATVLLEELRAAAARLPDFDDGRDSTTGPMHVLPREAGRFSSEQLIELVRVLGVNGRSGVLDVRSGPGGGTLVFHDGRVVAAQSLGGARGEEAAYELLALAKGEWVFEAGAGLVDAKAGQLVAPTHALVLEALRRRELRQMLETHQGE